MPSNFAETSVSRNARRDYNPIADLTTFSTAVQKFVSDTTMGITKKAASSKSYKAKIEYASVDDVDKGYVNYYGTDADTFEAMATFLEEKTAAETAAGADAYAVRDAVDDTWRVKYSCAIGDDTFTVTINRDYMLINGFTKDETLAAIETWADTVEEFGGEAI